MSDIELPIRGRTYREPEGPHSVVVRGRDIEPALQHVAARHDCRSLAVINLRPQSLTFPRSQAGGSSSSTATPPVCGTLRRSLSGRM